MRAMTARCETALPFPPWRLSGTVLGCLMNHRAALDALGDAAAAPPYKGAPRAPVLYVKPRNTLAGDGAAVTVPQGVPALEVGAALGLVIGRSACRVSEADALQHVSGAIVVADLSVPHPDFYRPSLRYKCRDGFCPLGPATAGHASLDERAVRVFVDGALVHEAHTGGRIRPAARLVADVSAFMTLSPGDVLMLGVSAGAPRVGPGHAVAIEIDGIGRLDLRLVAEGAAPDAAGGWEGEGTA